MIDYTTGRMDNMAAAYQAATQGADVSSAIQLNEFAKAEKFNQAVEQMQQTSRISFWNRVIFAPLKEGRQLSKLV